MEPKSPLKIGEKIKVYNFFAKVDCIWRDPATARTQIDITYEGFGKARVFLHDEGKVWHRLSLLN